MLERLSWWREECEKGIADARIKSNYHLSYVFIKLAVDEYNLQYKTKHRSTILLHNSPPSPKNEITWFGYIHNNYGLKDIDKVRKTSIHTLKRALNHLQRNVLSISYPLSIIVIYDIEMVFCKNKESDPPYKVYFIIKCYHEEITMFSLMFDKMKDSLMNSSKNLHIK